jgi:hypothetical protein
MDRINIARLISGYLDDELTDEEAARLATTLETDQRSLDRLVSNSFIHSQLLDWMDQPHVKDDAIAAAMVGLDGDGCPNAWPTAVIDQAALNRRSNADRAAHGGATRLRPLVRSWSALAAALLVAASISAVAYVIGSRPVFVGQLTDATDCRWGESQAEVPVGTLLEGGQQLELVQGSAVITFASGAKLLLEAPTRVRLDTPMQVHAIEGRIAAKVPRQAIGFTVTSSLARFIDLGTSFTVNLVAEKSFELHVFEGLVEVRLDQRFGEAARRPARVAEVRAVTFDVATGDVTNLHFQEGKQMPF